MIIRFLVLWITLGLSLPGFGENEKHKTGRFRISFTEYAPDSDLKSIIDRTKIQLLQLVELGHHYQIDKESYEVYVPSGYTPATPFGLFVWASPSDSGMVNEQWLPLMDKYKLIFIGANFSGNNTNAYAKRMPVTLDAVHNMKKLYSINPKRIYLSGLSGGGRISSMTTMHYPDIYAGGIFMIGCNYWKQVMLPTRSNAGWVENMTRPQQRYLTKAMHEGRYVFLTGDNDSNRDQTLAYYNEYRKFFEYTLYIQVPKMGHEPPPLNVVDQAIAFMVKEATAEKK